MLSKLPDLAADVVRFARKLYGPLAETSPAAKVPAFIETEEIRTAVHEAGHVVVMWAHTSLLQINHATIDAPGGGGLVSHKNSTDCDDRDYGWCMTVVKLAGIAAETYVFGRSHARNAREDLICARQHADQALGCEAPWELPDPKLSKVALGRAFRDPLTPDELRVLQYAYTTARFIIDGRRGAYYRLVSLLLTKRTISHGEIEEVLGWRGILNIYPRSTLILPR